MNIYYNPLDKKCRSRTGAIPRECELTLSVYADGVQECILDLNLDGRPSEHLQMRRTEGGWTITLIIHETGLYYYRFICDGHHYGRGQLRNAQINSEQGYQLTVYDENYSVPGWFKGGTMYQIFPDRFAKEGDCPVRGDKILRTDWGATPEFHADQKGVVRNNDFFGGNFNGILSKLDYLESLHVTVIYLNPIFESSSNHRYDTGDYMKTDSLLGTEVDFRNLVTEAKKRGMRVILDGVFNHTGDDSRYFNRYGHYDSVGAYQDPESPYHDWYDFYSFPDGYQSWWGIKTLPAVNEHSDGYQAFLFGEGGVIKHWLDAGISGYRLDVVDELPGFFVKKLRRAVKEKDSDAIIIGEVWEEATDKIAYGKRRRYFQGKELDSVMNYPLKNAILDYVTTGRTSLLAETIFMLIDDYPKFVLDSLMNIVSTHDTERILTVCGGKKAYDKEQMSKTFLTDAERQAAKQKVKLAATLQFMLPGVPCIYYGDENAMEGYIDPFCRRCYDWDNQDAEMIGFYGKLGEIRAKHRDILADGEYREVCRKDSSFFMFARVKDGKKCYVYTNCGPDSFAIYLSQNKTYRSLLTGRKIEGRIDAGPCSCDIFMDEQQLS